MGLASLLDVIVDEQTKGLLVAQEVERRIFNNQYRVAQMFARAGYFSDAQDEYKAMAKIEIGRSWGLSAADSMRYIYMVNGKPAVENEIVAAKLRRSGWDWEPQFIGGEGQNCKGVRLWIKKDGKPFMRTKRNDQGEVIKDKDGNPLTEQVSVSFLEDQAKIVKIHENGKQVTLLEKKGPWADGWRANMYYWRTIAQFRRFYANDLMSGALLVDEAADIRPIESKTTPELTALRGEIAADQEPDWVKKKATTATIADIRSMKTILGADSWAAVLKTFEASDPLDLKVEDRAQAALAMMKELAMKSAEEAA